VRLAKVSNNGGLRGDRPEARASLVRLVDVNNLTTSVIKGDLY
jgi:hypothetical protein